LRFAATGWRLFDTDPDLLVWLQTAGPAALRAGQDPAAQAQWLRHGETWFAGVGSLPNDATGAVVGSGALRSAALDWAQAQSGLTALDAAQVSIVYPGYPRQDAAESDTAHRYRVHRDAAHVDGLLPEGPMRRRYLREPHAWVLGVPVTACNADASPLVVWEGSHQVMRTYFAQVLDPHPPAKWDEIDLTETYHAARKACFEQCRRVEITAQPGQAYVLHRLALHGVAPWRAGAVAPVDGRVILYFRPEMTGGTHDWLSAP
jgi:hypothetical protein